MPILYSLDKHLSKATDKVDVILGRLCSIDFTMGRKGLEGSGRGGKRSCGEPASC